MATCSKCSAEVEKVCDKCGGCEGCCGCGKEAPAEGGAEEAPEAESEEAE